MPLELNQNKHLTPYIRYNKERYVTNIPESRSLYSYSNNDRIYRYT